MNTFTRRAKHLMYMQIECGSRIDRTTHNTTHNSPNHPHTTPNGPRSESMSAPRPHRRVAAAHHVRRRMFMPSHISNGKPCSIGFFAHTLHVKTASRRSEIMSRHDEKQTTRRHISCGKQKTHWSNSSFFDVETIKDYAFQEHTCDQMPNIKCCLTKLLMETRIARECIKAIYINFARKNNQRLTQSVLHRIISELEQKTLKKFFFLYLLNPVKYAIAGTKSYTESVPK